MKTLLKDIATIQTGVYGKTFPAGEIVYLQAKYFDEYGKLLSMPPPDLKLEKSLERHLLKPGDVLFAAKGTKNFAAVYEGYNPPAVASTSFFVIRLEPSILNRVLPEFLAWYINQPTTQKILKGQAIGTAIVSISKAALEALEVAVPSIEKQKAILHIHSLVETERGIRKRIEKLKENYIQKLLQKALK